MAHNPTRRQFIRLTLIASGAATLSPWLAKADDMPLLDEADPAAQAMGYHHQANDVDVKKFPRRGGNDGADQFCYNCALYQGDKSAAQGGCVIFPGKSVKARGWCNAWTPVR